jgi:hypothetical protein
VAPLAQSQALLSGRWGGSQEPFGYKVGWELPHLETNKTPRAPWIGVANRITRQPTRSRFIGIALMSMWIGGASSEPMVGIAGFPKRYAFASLNAFKRNAWIGMPQPLVPFFFQPIHRGAFLGATLWFLQLIVRRSSGSAARFSALCHDVNTSTLEALIRQVRAGSNIRAYRVQIHDSAQAPRPTASKTSHFGGAISGTEASKANCINRLYGAGDGNRTHVRNLGWEESRIDSIFHHFPIVA